MANNISFNTIPSVVRVPLFYAEFSTTATNQNQPSQWTLLIGQTITAQPAALTYISSAPQASSLFGAGSQLAEMVSHYRNVDPTGTLYVLPLADGVSSVASTGTVVFAGTSTAAGVVSLYVNGTAVPVAVASGVTGTVVGTSAAAAVNAIASLPVSASASLGTLTLTALNKGPLGNDIDIRLNYYGLQNNESTPAGITATVTAMSGGSIAPVLTGVSAIVGDQPFDFIISPYSDATSTTALTTMMNNTAGRWSYARQSYGHVFTAKSGGRGVSYSSAISTLTGIGAALNDPHLTMVGYFDSPNSPGAVAAEFGAAVAVSSKADPARPVQTLSLPGILPPPIGNQMAFSDKNTLLSTGVALFNVAGGNAVQILRGVTSYQTNAYGVADQSYLDCETLFTLMSVIRTLKAAITQKFPRAKLADNGTNVGFGSNVVTPNSLRAELIAQYAAMVNLGLVEDPGDFANGLVVQRNTQDASRVDVLFDPILVSGLRIMAVLTQFSLIAPNTTTPAIP